jgi:hypothetical protein
LSRGLESALERRKSEGDLTGKKVKVRPPRRRTTAPAKKPSLDSAVALYPSMRKLRASQVGGGRFAALLGSIWVGVPPDVEEGNEDVDFNARYVGLEDIAALLGETLGEGVTSNDTTDMTNVITAVRRSFTTAKCIDYDSRII